MVGVLALGLGAGPAEVNRPPASRVGTPAVSDNADEQRDPARAVVPARVNNPAVTLDQQSGRTAPVSAAVPTWVQHWLP